MAIALIFYNAPIALDDMFQYDMLARSMLNGEGFRWFAREDLEPLRPAMETFEILADLETPEDGLVTTFRAPGYPTFLYVLYHFGSLQTRFGLARVVQAVLSSLMAPMVVLLAFRMGTGRRVALVSGFAMAFYPLLSFYPVGLASENLFIPLVLLSFYALVRAADSTSFKATILAGLLLGAAMITRSIIAPFVLLASIWMGRFGQLGKRGPVLLLSLAFGICLPWAIRNSVIMGKPTFVETSLAYNLFVGYHPEGNGEFVSDVAVIPMTILDDVERNQFCMRSSLGFIRADPLEALVRVARRSAFFLGIEDREMTFFYSNNFLGVIPQPWLTGVYLLLVLPWIWTAIFAPYGVSQSPHRASAYLAMALFAGYALPHVFVLSEPRFHLALVPIALPFAAHGWMQRRRLAILIFKHSTWGRETILARMGYVILLLLWVWGFAIHWPRLLSVMGAGGNKIYLSY
jgi:hypothetical protein